ncbi:MAG: response regulator [Ruminococcus sp.]|nr:response regulator [Ruminococcus sp.]MDE6672023.1 response regulator [Ruminococcus sp.]MDE6796921.1 response regulator [Ruminococcus sp.]
MYNVLLVEDDSALRFIYSKMKTWTECGFTIAKQASNGKDALEILKTRTFDLIFTDIRMPFVDGIEMLRKLSASDNKIPVIFASSYDEFEYARQGLILGAFDYLLKPVDEKKLAQVLGRLKEHIEATAQEEKIDESVIEVFRQLEIDPDSSPFVHNCALYFSKHFGEVFTIDDVAIEQGYSKDYFGKIFKKHFNMTFNEVYSRIKVAYAIKLLRTGNYKAYEISDILGYASVDYFTKIFKEITGETPSRFKARLDGR